jgi:hypothetical protein
VTAGREVAEQGTHRPSEQPALSWASLEGVKGRNEVQGWPETPISPPSCTALSLIQASGALDVPEAPMPPALCVISFELKIPVFSWDRTGRSCLSKVSSGKYRPRTWDSGGPVHWRTCKGHFAPSSCCSLPSLPGDCHKATNSFTLFTHSMLRPKP